MQQTCLNNKIQKPYSFSKKLLINDSNIKIIDELHIKMPEYTILIANINIFALWLTYI